MIGKWYYGFGRKKNASSKVFLKEGKGNILINKKRLILFFSRKSLINLVYDPIRLTNFYSFDFYVNSKGGGEVSKAIATMYGISKAIIDFEYSYKQILKKNNILNSDLRIVERKKIGHIKSRKIRQYSKR
ncbi:30S ribosomal protein S9 [Candidatus Vidania fulgoroideorum]